MTPDPEPRSKPICYADESWRDDDRQGHFYLVAGVVTDRADPDYKRLISRLRHIACRQPSRTIHASRMAATPDGRAALAEAETLIGASPSVRALIVVRAPLGPSAEHARQRCLAHLAAALDRQNVTELWTDTRTGSRANEYGDPDSRDRRTVNELQAAGEITRRLVLRPVDDAHAHGIWLPDIVAYAASRSLAHNSPQRLSRLAARLRFLEATTTPVAQRTDPQRTDAPATALTPRLDEHLARARTTAPPGTQDGPAAETALHRVEEWIAARQTHHGPVPTLDHLLGRDSARTGPDLGM
ncbi:MAG: hypothetical protein LBH76_09460 [Propionibacteriaceae bacterium]|jgi:hypothetical protein|nr:hypothetical protein [Propionibacteriaceae bacterium]